MSSLAFNRAIVRTAPRSVVDGIRAFDIGAPDIAGVAREQAAYVSALEAAGVTVDVLPALEAFPDSLFVEDTALVFSGAAILLRPGAATRRGETAEIAAALEQRFERLSRLQEGTVEGGDVLVTPRVVFIGVSARTSADGANALVRSLAEIGLEGRPVATPPGVLHFKSDCSLLDDSTILATPRLAMSGVFEGFRVVLTAEGEERAANAIRVNERVFLSAGYSRTAEALDDLGYSVVALDTQEIAKIDAGLSCLSLRWQAS